MQGLLEGSIDDCLGPVYWIDDGRHRKVDRKAGKHTCTKRIASRDFPFTSDHLEIRGT